MTHTFIKIKIYDALLSAIDQNCYSGLTLNVRIEFGPAFIEYDVSIKHSMKLNELTNPHYSIKQMYWDEIFRRYNKSSVNVNLNGADPVNNLTKVYAESVDFIFGAMEVQARSLGFNFGVTPIVLKTGTSINHPPVEHILVHDENKCVFKIKNHADD